MKIKDSEKGPQISHDRQGLGHVTHMLAINSIRVPSLMKIGKGGQVMGQKWFNFIPVYHYHPFPETVPSLQPVSPSPGREIFAGPQCLEQGSALM